MGVHGCVWISGRLSVCMGVYGDECVIIIGVRECLWVYFRKL